MEPLQGTDGELTNPCCTRWSFCSADITAPPGTSGSGTGIGASSSAAAADALRSAPG